MKDGGITLVELLIVIAIIGILAMIAVPTYIGQQKRAARTEAYTNLKTLRLLQEQYYAENGEYAPPKRSNRQTLGRCAPGNPGDISDIEDIQKLGPENKPEYGLPGFKPGRNLNFSYCIEKNKYINPNTQKVEDSPTPCFVASAFGDLGTRVGGDVFRIDCNNNRNF